MSPAREFEYEEFHASPGHQLFIAIEKGRPECFWAAETGHGLTYHYYGLRFPIVAEFHPRTRRQFRERHRAFLRKWAEGVLQEPYSHANQHSRKRGLI